MEIYAGYLERWRVKFIEISQLKKSWQTEIGTQVNVIPQNKNLSCYNIVDKAISIMSRNIEPGIINYVSLY